MKSLLLCLAMIALVGCGQSANDPMVELTEMTLASTVLCGECGQVKESEACCAEDAETCSKCSLAKGSPGCCKIEKGTDVTLCSGCGQVKGSELCCSEEGETCKCGFHKGSPACCKIEKPKAGSHHDHDHDGDEV